MFAVDLWCHPRHLREPCRVLAMLVKLALGLAANGDRARHALHLSWIVVVWSAVVSHAPASFRHAGCSAADRPLATISTQVLRLWTVARCAAMIRFGCRPGALPHFSSRDRRPPGRGPAPLGRPGGQDPRRRQGPRRGRLRRQHLRPRFARSTARGGGWASTSTLPPRAGAVWATPPRSSSCRSTRSSASPRCSRRDRLLSRKPPGR